MEHFFPRIQVDTYVQMHITVKLLGGCRCRPYSNYWGEDSQIFGGIHPPGFRHPFHPSPTVSLYKLQNKNACEFFSIYDFMIYRLIN